MANYKLLKPVSINYAQQIGCLFPNFKNNMIPAGQVLSGYQKAGSNIVILFSPNKCNGQDQIMASTDKSFVKLIPNAVNDVVLSGYSNYSGDRDSQISQATADCEAMYPGDDGNIQACISNAISLIDTPDSSGSGSGSSTNTSSGNGGLPNWIKDLIHEGETFLKPGATSGNKPGTTLPPKKQTLVLGMQPAIAIPVILVSLGALIWGGHALYKMAAKDK